MNNKAIQEINALSEETLEKYFKDYKRPKTAFNDVTVLIKNDGQDNKSEKLIMAFTRKTKPPEIDLQKIHDKFFKIKFPFLANDSDKF